MTPKPASMLVCSHGSLGSSMAMSRSTGRSGRGAHPRRHASPLQIESCCHSTGPDRADPRLNQNTIVVVRFSSQQGDLNRLLSAHLMSFRVGGVRFLQARSSRPGIQRSLQLEAGDLSTTVNPLMVQVDAFTANLGERWTQISTRIDHLTLLEITLSLAVLLILLCLLKGEFVDPVNVLIEASTGDVSYWLCSSNSS